MCQRHTHTHTHTQEKRKKEKRKKEKRREEKRRGGVFWEFCKHSDRGIPVNKKTVQPKTYTEEKRD